MQVENVESRRELAHESLMAHVETVHCKLSRARHSLSTDRTLAAVRCGKWEMLSEAGAPLLVTDGRCPPVTLLHQAMFSSVMDPLSIPEDAVAAACAALEGVSDVKQPSSHCTAS